MIAVSLSKPINMSDDAAAELKQVLPDSMVPFFRFEKIDESIEDLIEEHYEPCYDENESFCVWTTCTEIAESLKRWNKLQELPSANKIGKYLTACDYYSKVRRMKVLRNGVASEVMMPQKAYLVKLILS